MPKSAKQSSTSFLEKVLVEKAQLATVCTEPAAIALASAKARSLIDGELRLVVVKVSQGIMKNALLVGLPGTGRCGPDVAAALGVTGGRPELSLEVLRDISPEHVENAHRLLDRGLVKVLCDYDFKDKVRVEATVVTNRHVSEVTISGGHSRIVSITVDNEQQQTAGPSLENASLDRLRTYTFNKLLEQALTLNITKMGFFMSGAQSLLSFARKMIEENEARRKPSHQFREGDPLREIRNLVEAAASGRMKGISWPILTSGGSGNQGIVVHLPILIMARRVGASETQTLRAFAVAHAVNLYIKSFMGEVSSICGAISAGAGVAAGTCWLLGGDHEQMEHAVQRVLGTLYGMLCDGAKASCAAKCGVAAVEGVIAGETAASGGSLVGSQGVLASSLEQTLELLERIGQQSFGGIDQAIIQART